MRNRSRNFMLFMPDSEPGRYVYGFPENARIMELAARRLGLNYIPVGDSVAAAFPWMRTVQWDVDDGDPPSVVRRDPWDYTFANNGDSPIPIHELRINAERDAPATFPAGWETDLLVKVSIPNRRQIFERWIPWKALNTDPTAFVDGYLNQFAFQLPAPYFLSRSNVFQIDVLYNANLIGVAGTDHEEMFFVTLHGWGVWDGEPIELIAPILSWAAAPVNANMFQPFSFVDGRDQPMRDAFITHIGFGGGQLGNNLNALEQIRVRLQPPEGPKWHQDEFYQIADLAVQLGTNGANGNPTPCAIHRPIVPYVLQPGESMRVEFRHTDWEDANQNYHLDVTAHGTQPGKMDFDELERLKPPDPAEDKTITRAIVRPCPEIKYVAEGGVKLVCTVNERNSDGSENSPVSIRRLPRGGKLGDDDWSGVELPYNSDFAIRLNAGDALVAITKDEALMSIREEPT